MATREEMLFAQLARGLLKHGQQQTITQLGDRSLYIGMSDVGKGVECMRAAVAGKLGLAQTDGGQVQKWFTYGRHEQITTVLRKQLVLQRGHWLEAGLFPAFEANGSTVLPQLEIETEYQDVPIKVHIDFVFVAGGDKPSLRILELKSTKRLPDALYTAYETQLYGQMGFLVSCWNQPRFNWRDKGGELVVSGFTFPEIVKHMFRVNLSRDPAQVDVEGWVLCLSMDDAKAFGPYQSSDSMLRLCQKTAEAIWNAKSFVESGRLELNELEYRKGFYALCDYCDHADLCSKFKAEIVDDSEYDSELAHLLFLKEERSRLQEKIAEKEEQIKLYFDLQGYTTEVLKTVGHRVTKTHYSGSVRTDLQKLTELLKNEICPERLEEVLAAATVTGKPYDRLSIVKRKEG